jgi:hypothetical protein
MDRGSSVLSRSSFYLPKKIRSPQECRKGFTDLLPLCLWELRSCNQNDIPSWFDVCHMLLQCSPQTSLCAVAQDRIADSPSGCYAKPGFLQTIGGNDQNGERVGIGFPFTPHPLEVGRAREPIIAVHFSSRAIVKFQLTNRSGMIVLPHPETLSLPVDLLYVIVHPYT